VLPAAHRMRRGADFTAAVRGGRRAARSTLVLHVTSRPESEAPCRVGLIVSRAIGNSVIRHRVARRLRAASAERLARWNPGDLVVIRALPAAGRATSDELKRDLDGAMIRLGASA
jgi:ribonuclease P protein component